MPGEIDQELAARGARTQSLFRDVNERVKSINEAFSVAIRHGDWMCECANDGCAERLALSTVEYEAIRANGKRFAVAVGDTHIFPDIEDVVERTERYWVVEKTGQAGDLAANVDPRRANGGEPRR
jgi:hypothetical protein